MGSLSEDEGDQILHKMIDTLILEVEDTREQLLQTEERLETRIRNLHNDAEKKEAKHQEEIIHLTEEIKELHEKIGNESRKDVTNDDEFKECMDVGDNSIHQFLDIIIENEPASNDTGRDLEGNSSQGSPDVFIENNPVLIGYGRNNQTDGSAYDSGNIEVRGVTPDLSSEISRRFSTLLCSDETENEMHTSESFHMYSAATISDPSNTCGKVWLITITSVVITMVQFLILDTLIIEANDPTCVSHQDCRIGEYCDYDIELVYKGTPRCGDCADINDYTQKYNISNCFSVLDGYKDMSHTDYADVDHMNIAWKVNFDYTDLEQFCFAQLHCSETDLLEDRCDFIVNQFNKLHATQVITLIFMSLLLAVLLSRDVQDAIAEERYLNHGLMCGSIKPSSQFAAVVLRIALRARQIVIPWYAGAAAASIIISETMDTKNIMLNLLTIDIILIADDLLATLCLPLLDQSATEKLMKSASDHKVTVSLIWSRIHGFAVSISLVLVVCFFEPLLIFFNPESQSRCSEMFFAYDKNVFICPLFVIILHGVGHIVLDHKSVTKCKAIMRGIGEIFLDLVSFAFFCPLASYIVIIGIYQSANEHHYKLGLGLFLLVCFISFEVLRLYTSWQPIQVLSLNLFGM